VVAGPVLQFAVIGLIAAAFVGSVTAIASRRIGEREAVVDARTAAIVKAQGAVEPVVTPALVAGDPATVSSVGVVVDQKVIDPQLVRVKIWRRDGTVVYSNEPRLIGQRYDLGADDLAALDQGVVSADVSDLSKPENQYERQFGKLLQVYVPLRVPGGDRLLFEAYFRYDAVSAAGNRIWRSFAPVTLGALAALELVQLPIAWSLARRLRQRQREREALLVHALEASDVERRRIASDLHDGVVQDLAGVAFSLTGAARDPSTDSATSELLERSAGTVRSGVTSLRSLLVEIYPPNLEEEGLGAALAELLARAERVGVTTTLQLDGLDRTAPSVAQLLYRAAQEGLRNVITHAQATGVEVRGSRHDDTVVLEVADDGVGVDTARADQRASEGHVGLRTLEGLVRDAGGTLTISSPNGRGTVLRVEVPVR
jgi:signal transduction histidine kinase